MIANDSLHQAWHSFQQAIETARQKIEATDRFKASERNRAAVYRNLSQIQAMAYNLAVAPSVDHPRIFGATTYQTNIYTLGLACQDFYYGATFLDGAKRYRLSGRLGATRWFAAQVQSHLLGDPQAKNLGDYNLANFCRPGSGGRFEVILSAAPVDGPYIPLDPSSRYHFLWIRRILGDWNDDHGELRVETLEPVATAEPDELGLIDRLHGAAHLATFLLENWGIGLYDNFLKLAGGSNRPGELGGSSVSDKDVGSPQAFYTNFVYRIAPGEALIIEGRVPNAPYWGIQLGDVWGNSLDFMNHQSDLNMQRVVQDSDGLYRAVVSACDPGAANWLDTEGNFEGIGMFRAFDCAERPAAASFRVVKFDALREFLPADTVYVDPTARMRQIRYRQDSLRKLYDE